MIERLNDLVELDCASLSPQLLMVGLGLTLLSVGWLVVQERKRNVSSTESRGPESSLAVSRSHLWLLALALVIGAGLRAHGPTSGGLGHTEIYIPGIDLPEGISEPPPRHAFEETLAWHFHSEPHPMGYYLAGWAWTRVFGTSELALRLPSVLLGIASILLIFEVGSRFQSRDVGCAAALMLALHGFHVYWSQIARMYVPGAFLGLLATLLLFEITRRSRHRGLLEAAYVLVLVMGIFTVEFFWPLLALHMGWVLLFHPGARNHVPRALSVQVLALILGSPALLQAAYTARRGAVPDPAFPFLIDYFSFGFLFARDVTSDPHWQLPLAFAAILACLALVFVFRGLRGSRSNPPREDAGHALPVAGLVLAASGVAVVIVGMACAATRRQIIVSFVALPLGTLLIQPAVATAGPWIHRIRSRLFERLRWAPPLCSLVALLALVPAVVLFSASFLVSVLAPRAFLVFVPYLLVLTAAGALALGRSGAIARATAATLIPLFVASAVVFEGRPTSPRDYRGLGEAIVEDLAPGDLVFVRPVDWHSTPLFYYLPNDQIVARDYRAALASRPEARVWVPRLDYVEPPPGVREALSGYRLSSTVEARRAIAELYEREP